jgi:flagellar motor switch/type III secretory pathway protein FliN
MPEPSPANRPHPQLGEISWDKLPAAVTAASETPVEPDAGSISLGVCLGTTTMTSGEAGQLCIDQLVTMDESAGDHVEILFDGELRARGILITLNGNFGIRITGLEDPASQ